MDFFLRLLVFYPICSAWYCFEFFCQILKWIQFFFLGTFSWNILSIPQPLSEVYPLHSSVFVDQNRRMERTSFHIHSIRQCLFIGRLRSLMLRVINKQCWFSLLCCVPSSLELFVPYYLFLRFSCVWLTSSGSKFSFSHFNSVGFIGRLLKYAFIIECLSLSIYCN